MTRPPAGGGWRVDLCGAHPVAWAPSGEWTRVEPGETLTSWPDPAPMIGECLHELPRLHTVGTRGVAARVIGRWLAARCRLEGAGLLIVPSHYPVWLRTGLRDGMADGGASARVCDGGVAGLVAAVAHALKASRVVGPEIEVDGGRRVSVSVTRELRPVERWLAVVGNGVREAARSAPSPADMVANEVRLAGAEMLSGVHVLPRKLPIVLRRTSLLVVRARDGSGGVEVPLPSNVDGYGRADVELPGEAREWVVGHRFADVPPGQAAEAAVLSVSIPGAALARVSVRRRALELWAGAPAASVSISLNELIPPAVL